MLLRRLGWREGERQDRTYSARILRPRACEVRLCKHSRDDDARVLVETDPESIKVAVRGQRILSFEEFVARMGKERLPKRVTFGEMVGGKATRVGVGRNGIRCGASRRTSSIPASSPKDGVRQHRNPAHDFEGSRTRRRLTCGDGMLRKRALQKSDTRRLQPRHGPWTPMHPGGGGDADRARGGEWGRGRRRGQGGTGAEERGGSGSLSAPTLADWARR